jgi:hypothetical protein
MNLAEWTDRLLVTASVLSGLQPVPPPPVSAIPEESLQARVCDSRCLVRGAYIPGAGVLIAETLDIDGDPRDRSVLLHELVHYLQDRAGRFGSEPPCERYVDRELEAYRVQDRYLARYNLALSTPSDYTQWLPAGCHGLPQGDDGPIALDRLP